MKTLIILFSSCLFCFGLSASETLEDPKFKQLLRYTDNFEIETKLIYLIDMQERSDMNNPSFVRHFSVQLAIELQIIEKNIQRRCLGCIEGIKYLKDQIYTSSDINEIKSWLSSIDENEKYVDQSEMYLECIEVLRDKYCPWLKDL